MHRPLAILAASASLLLAQAPAASGPLAKPLTYTGKPLAIAPDCRSEDLSSLGLDCGADQPCPVLLELASAETVSTRLLLAGNLHTSAVTLQSLLLTSEDGGGTWSEGYARIPGAALDQIQFVDFETGWISGQVIAALPRDPFFLISGDGGKSWHRHPVFGEPRAGAVEGFWFSSGKQGAMTVDRLQPDENGIRYELYQSRTGGTSWTLEQLSQKPIALKRPPKPESDLRLLADPASQSYKVQRRTGDKWQTLAAFAIAAGECRVPETTLAETPPEAETPKPETPKTVRKKR